MISSIFQIANTKPQIQLLTIRLENKEGKLNKTITPSKIPKTRYSFIYLPINFEAETLVLGS